MIHVNIPDEGIKIEGTLGDIVADVCTVLTEICDESKIDPCFLIDHVKSTFLTGYRMTHTGEDEDDHEKGEANKFDSTLTALADAWLTETIGEILKKGVEADVEDERSKETVQGTGRRARRRLH